MENYCRKTGIFFDENDRIKNAVKTSENLHKEFKGSVVKGFKDMALRGMSEE